MAARFCGVGGMALDGVVRGAEDARCGGRGWYLMCDGLGKRYRVYVEWQLICVRKGGGGVGVWGDCWGPGGGGGGGES